MSKTLDDIITDIMAFADTIEKKEPSRAKRIRDIAKELLKGFTKLENLFK